MMRIETDQDMNDDDDDDLHTYLNDLRDLNDFEKRFIRN